jgi:hypothetical protein
MHTRQEQTELAFTFAKNATKPNPIEILSLQTTRKENNWKTKETKNLFILFYSRINENSARNEFRVGGSMTSALFWGFTQRRFLVTGVLEKNLSVPSSRIEQSMKKFTMREAPAEVRGNSEIR